VEETGMAEEYESTPEWRQAAAARARIRRAAAWQSKRQIDPTLPFGIG
jgi:hypothetical protein